MRSAALLLLAIPACTSASTETVEVRADGADYVAVQDLATGEILGSTGALDTEDPFVVTTVCGNDVRSLIVPATSVDVSCPPTTGEVVTIIAPGTFEVHIGPASGVMEDAMDVRVPAGHWDLVAIEPDTGAVLIQPDVVIEGPTEIVLDPAKAVVLERRGVAVYGSTSAELFLETELRTPRGTVVRWPGVDGTARVLPAFEGTQTVHVRTDYVGYTSVAGFDYVSNATDGWVAPLEITLPAPLADASIDLTSGIAATWSSESPYAVAALTITQYRGTSPRTWRVESFCEPLAMPSLAPLRETAGWNEAWEIAPDAAYRWLLELRGSMSSVTWSQAR